MSRIYKLRAEYVFHYKDIFGNKKTRVSPKGSLAYEGIDYGMGRRTYYFSKKAGNEGEPVGLISEIENNPSIFELISNQ